MPLLPKKVRKAISRRRERLKAQLLDIGGPMRRSVMKSTKDMVKESMLSDPDMWRWAKGFIGGMIDSFFYDIEQEMERTIEASLLKAVKTVDYDDYADIEGPTPRRKRFLRGYYSARAFVLHHWLPFNRSWFGQVKDPVYLVCLAITYCNLLPGLRVGFYAVVLLFLVAPGPPDEFQLINFILAFKRTQFVSQGIFSSLYAAVDYFSCWTFEKEGVRDCIDQDGPGQSASALPDYIGSILLVWIAFSFLPRAVKRHLDGIQYVGRPEEELEYQMAGRSLFFFGVGDHPKALGRVFADDPTRGGRMGKLLYYDLKAFMASCVLLIVLTLTASESMGKSWDSPQMRANLFWAKVFYAYLSLPFFILGFPLALTILTHTDPTGFTRNGACVAFKLPDVTLPVPGEKDDLSPKSSGTGLPPEDDAYCFPSGWGPTSFFAGDQEEEEAPDSRVTACTVCATAGLGMMVLFGY